MNESLTSQLSDAFGIPTCTWSQQYQKATGFFLVDEAKQADGQISSYNTCFRFLIKSLLATDHAYPGLKSTWEYEWTEIGFWTQWKSSESSILLCMIHDKGKLGIWNEMRKLLRDVQTIPVQAGPFVWHQLVLPIISQAFDRSVWTCRDRIRELERNRPRVSSVRPQYADMHEIARHIVHISETLDMSINVLDSILQEIRNFEQTRASREQDSAFEPRAAVRLLGCQKTLLQCALGRSQALTSRLQNEINLVHCVSAINCGTMADASRHSTSAQSAIVLSLPRWLELCSKTVPQ